MEKDFDLVFEPISSERKKCGCYVVNPELLQQRHNQFILVPLKSSEYHLEIVNSIANVSLVQSYHNPTENFWRWSIAFQPTLGPVSTSLLLSSEKLGLKGWSKRKKRQRRSTRRQSNKAEKQPMAILIPTVRTSSTLRLEIFPPANPSELRFHISKSSVCPAILSTRSI